MKTQYGKILKEESGSVYKKTGTYRHLIVIVYVFCGHSRSGQLWCECDFAVDTRNGKGLQETLILSTRTFHREVLDMLLWIFTSKQV